MRRSDYAYLRRIGLRAIDAFKVAKLNDTPGQFEIKLLHGAIYRFNPWRCEIRSGTGTVLFRYGEVVRPDARPMPLAAPRNWIPYYELATP